MYMSIGILTSSRLDQASMAKVTDWRPNQTMKAAATSVCTMSSIVGAAGLPTARSSVTAYIRKKNGSTSRHTIAKYGAAASQFFPNAIDTTSSAQTASPTNSG